MNLTLILAVCVSVSQHCLFWYSGSVRKGNEEDAEVTDGENQRHSRRDGQREVAEGRKSEKLNKM